MGVAGSKPEETSKFNKMNQFTLDIKGLKKEIKALTPKEIVLMSLATIAVIIAMGVCVSSIGWVATLWIIGISIGMTGLAMYFTFRHYKEVDKIKVGDIVYLRGNDDESEVIEADETHLVIKTRCYRAKVSVKKQK